MKPIKYIGKQNYCYANATAMLLASIKEHVLPSKLEVLSGIGLGAFFEPHANFLFFSNLAANPDEGISRALKMLGFAFEERYSDTPDNPPFEELKKVLSSGPAVLGPIELGILPYNPSQEGEIGADHYVLAYAMDGERVYVNDPYGFPQVSLSLEELQATWRANMIFYKRGFYQYWFDPKRVSNPTEDEIAEAAIKSFLELYRTSRERAVQENALIGADAILHQAARIRDGKTSPEEIGFYTDFMFPMSASRALDYADFFEGRNPELGEIKRKQAALFGQAHVQAVAKDWNGLAKTLVELAEAETKFEKTFTNA